MIDIRAHVEYTCPHNGTYLLPKLSPPHSTEADTFVVVDEMAVSSLLLLFPIYLLLYPCRVLPPPKNAEIKEPP